MTITLPYPPSANRYWRHARGMTFLSAEAKAYIADVSDRARTAGIRPLPCEVSVTLDVYRPRRSGDLDNTQKVLLDALNGHAYADDGQIVELHARRFEDKKNPRVEVTVTPAAAANEGGG